MEGRLDIQTLDPSSRMLRVQLLLPVKPRHKFGLLVDQYVDAVRAANRHRVGAVGQSDDFAIARGDDDAAGGVDRQAIAQHALAENRADRTDNA